MDELEKKEELEPVVEEIEEVVEEPKEESAEETVVSLRGVFFCAIYF